MPPFDGNDFGGMRVGAVGAPTLIPAIPLPKNVVSMQSTVTAFLITRPSSEYKYLFIWLMGKITAGTNVLMGLKQGDHVPRTAAAATNVDITDNEFDITAHGYETGDGPYKITTTTTLPEPFATTPNLLVWVRAVTANAISFHPTYADAIAGTNEVDLTTTGVGTHTVGGLTVAAATITAEADIGQIDLLLPHLGGEWATPPLLCFLAPEKMTVNFSAGLTGFGIAYWYTK